MHASGAPQRFTSSQEDGAACTAVTPPSESLPSSWLEERTSHQVFADGYAAAEATASYPAAEAAAAAPHPAAEAAAAAPHPAAEAAAAAAAGPGDGEAEAAARDATDAASKAGEGRVFLAALPSPLSSRMLAAVEKSISLCCAFDAARREDGGGLCEGKQEIQDSTAKEQKALFAVVAAAEEARMHQWTIAGCDGLLKLLVATAVQNAKKTQLFSADAHASFL
ncbi:hypothetical protein Emag_002547 [Eimeria magna]